RLFLCPVLELVSIQEPLHQRAGHHVLGNRSPGAGKPGSLSRGARVRKWSNGVLECCERSPIKPSSLCVFCIAMSKSFRLLKFLTGVSSGTLGPPLSSLPRDGGVVRGDSFDFWLRLCRARYSRYNRATGRVAPRKSFLP